MEWSGGNDKNISTNDATSKITENSASEAELIEKNTDNSPLPGPLEGTAVEESMKANDSMEPGSTNEEDSCKLNVNMEQALNDDELLNKSKNEEGPEANTSTFEGGSLTDVQHIKTLHDSISYFKLNQVLRDLEKSLEGLRKCEKTVPEHEDCVKRADKVMQKMCLRFHPDRFSGSSEEALSVAQELQIALNTTRTVLSVMSKEFLEELHVCYKYAFFMDARLNSLGNEVHIRNRLTEVSCKIGLLSEITQQQIVVQIQKFLRSSHACVNSYKVSKIDEFKKHKHLALFHLEKCIAAYERLHREFAIVERECRDEGLVIMRASIDRMSDSSSTAESFLKILLLESSRHSLDGTIQVFFNFNLMDEYFVLPFAYYVNVLLMCSIVLRIRLKSDNRAARAVKWFKNFNAVHPSLPIHQGQSFEEVKSLSNAYYLVSYMEDQTRYPSEVRHLMGGPTLDMEVLRNKFDQIMTSFADFLKSKFAIDSYNVCSGKANLMKKITQLNAGMESEILEEDRKFASHMESFREMNERRRREFLEIVKKTEESKQRFGANGTKPHQNS